MKEKVFVYLLGDGGCQVSTSTIPRHNHTRWVHRVLGQNPPLEEVLDHTVHVLKRHWKVVGGSQAISGSTTQKGTDLQQGVMKSKFTRGTRKWKWKDNQKEMLHS